MAGITGNMAKAVTGLAAAAIGAWMMKENYQGNTGKWQQIHLAHHENDTFQYMMHGHGEFNGQPTMTHWSHQLYHSMLFGPYGVKSSWHRFKTFWGGVLNDVVLTPAGALTGFGLYASMGKKVFTPFQWAAGALAKSVKPGNMVHSIGKAALDGTLTLLNGVGKFLAGKGSLLTKGGLGSAALVATLGFLGYQFWRVHTHQEQHDYWASQHYNGGH